VLSRLLFQNVFGVDLRFGLIARLEDEVDLATGDSALVVDHLEEGGLQLGEHASD